jgi:hypothetical protein
MPFVEKLPPPPSPPSQASTRDKKNGVRPPPHLRGGWRRVGLWVVPDQTSSPTVSARSARSATPINPTASLRCLHALSDRHLVCAWSSGMTCISTRPACMPRRGRWCGWRPSSFLRWGMVMGWFSDLGGGVVEDGDPSSLNCLPIYVLLRWARPGVNVVRAGSRGHGLAFSWVLCIHVGGTWIVL